MSVLRRSSLVAVGLLGSMAAIASTARGEGALTPGQEATQRLFVLVLIPAMAIGILVMVLVAYAVLKFRVRPGHTEGPAFAKTHDRKLEAAWTILPALILLVVGVVSTQALLLTDTVPENPDVVVKVSAQRFAWSFNVTDPDDPSAFVNTDSEFTVRVGQVVKLVFESVDVAHSFYIPAFELKIDVIPGHANVYWFQALQAGEFEIHCAEFCGLAHYSMIGLLHVVAA
jgi:cytochrome c oxidase subunit 2